MYTYTCISGHTYIYIVYNCIYISYIELNHFSVWRLVAGTYDIGDHRHISGLEATCCALNKSFGICTVATSRKGC